jgi:hypothetical protein
MSHILRKLLYISLCRASPQGSDTTPSSAFCGQQSGSRLQPVAGLLHAGGSLASTPPSSVLCKPPSGSRLRPVAGLWRAGVLPASTTPCSALSAGRRPAAGSGRLQGCCTRRAGLAGFNAPILQSAGRSLAISFGWLQGLRARGAAGFDDPILCTLRAVVRQPGPAGCRASVRRGHTGFDNTMLCTQRAVVGSGRLQGCCALLACWFLLHHVLLQLLHSAGTVARREQ